MKSIGSVKLKGLIGLIGLIKSNQVNKNLLHVHFFRHCFSSIYIEGARENLSKATTEFFLLCIGGKRWVEREQKRVEGVCALIETLL